MGAASGVLVDLLAGDRLEELDVLGGERILSKVGILALAYA